MGQLGGGPQGSPLSTLLSIGVRRLAVQGWRCWQRPLRGWL